MEGFLFLLLRLTQSSRGTSSPSVCGCPRGRQSRHGQGASEGSVGRGVGGAVEKRGGLRGTPEPAGYTGNQDSVHPRLTGPPELGLTPSRMPGKLLISKRVFLNLPPHSQRRRLYSRNKTQICAIRDGFCRHHLHGFVSFRWISCNQAHLQQSVGARGPERLLGSQGQGQPNPSWPGFWSLGAPCQPSPRLPQ